MKRLFLLLFVSLGLLGVGGSDVHGWGFGGFRGGYGRVGGFDRGGYGGFDRYGGYGRVGGFDRGYGGGYAHGFSSFSGADRYGGSYSGYRSGSAYSGWGGRGATGTYDHNWTDAAGGSISTSGTRGAYEGRYGGVAAGGTRDTTLTTAGGRTYSADRQAGFASGPYGRTVGGASGSYEGRYGAGGWESAFSGNRYAGDMSHFTGVYGVNGAHSTAYWSTGYLGTRGTAVRTGFGYYGCFHPAWYGTHPGCWLPAAWGAGAAWAAVSYPAVTSFCGLPATDPPDYDYGTTVVYQGNNVYVNGQDAGTAQQFATQATAIADAGQTAPAPPTDDWKALGVYALVQGDQKTSNDIFQLAVNKEGIIRGNYYDGLMDVTTPVYGSVDKKTQRAAWTIGKKKDRVFEAGVYNLTQPQCPCLLHIGTQRTDQVLLVRVEQPSNNTK
jgi:hypothetical protein